MSDSVVKKLLDLAKSAENLDGAEMVRVLRETDMLSETPFSGPIKAAVHQGEAVFDDAFYQSMVGHVGEIGKFYVLFAEDKVFVSVNSQSLGDAAGLELTREEAIEAKTIDGLLVLLETELAIKVVADAGS